MRVGKCPVSGKRNRAEILPAVCTPVLSQNELTVYRFGRWNMDAAVGGVLETSVFPFPETVICGIPSELVEYGCEVFQIFCTVQEFCGKDKTSYLFKGKVYISHEDIYVFLALGIPVCLLVVGVL